VLYAGITMYKGCENDYIEKRVSRGAV